MKGILFFWLWSNVPKCMIIKLYDKGLCNQYLAKCKYSWRTAIFNIANLESKKIYYDATEQVLKAWLMKAILTRRHCSLKPLESPLAQICTYQLCILPTVEANGSRSISELVRREIAKFVLLWYARSFMMNGWVLSVECS